MHKKFHYRNAHERLTFYCIIICVKNLFLDITIYTQLYKYILKKKNVYISRKIFLCLIVIKTMSECKTKFLVIIFFLQNIISYFFLLILEWNIIWTCSWQVWWESPKQTLFFWHIEHIFRPKQEFANDTTDPHPWIIHDCNLYIILNLKDFPYTTF